MINLQHSNSQLSQKRSSVSFPTISHEIHLEHILKLIITKLFSHVVSLPLWQHVKK